MKRSVWRAGREICIGLAIIILASAVTQATPRPGRAVATRITGTAEYRTANSKDWNPLKVGMALSEGLSVRTHAGSTADFALTTGAIIRLSANSQITLETLSQEAHGIPSNGQLPAVTDRTQITLDQGQLNSKVRKLSANSSYVVRTPVGPVEVKGTAFAVWRSGTSVYLRTVDGTVNFKVGGRLVALPAGQQISFDYDPLTGYVRGINNQATPAPTDDAVAKLFQDFQGDTQGLDVVVLSEGVVDIDQLLQATPTSTSLPGTPSLILVGNPSATTSPSGF